MEDRMSFVYLVTNTVTGQMYVGITRGIVRDRWKHHRHAAKKGHQSPLAEAMRTYGKDAFTVEQIAEAPSWSEACQLEAQFIKAYKSHANHGGYNQTAGG